MASRGSAAGNSTQATCLVHRKTETQWLVFCIISYFENWCMVFRATVTTSCISSSPQPFCYEISHHLVILFYYYYFLFSTWHSWEEDVSVSQWKESLVALTAHSVWSISFSLSGAVTPSSTWINNSTAYQQLEGIRGKSVQSFQLLQGIKTWRWWTKWEEQKVVSVVTKGGHKNIPGARWFTWS